MFEFEDNLANAAKIKVIGVGGGGGNALKTMMRAGLEGVEFIAANTDIQVLRTNEAPFKIQLGNQLTRGLGAGSNPEVGRNAALEDIQAIQEAIRGADLVFITAGLGGGTGTGAAPVIARVARELGALTVGVVTMPFSFEGKKRQLKAEQGIHELRQEVDTLITIPNEKLLLAAGKTTAILDAFKMADSILLKAVKGISDLITIPGLINLDFADVRTVMAETGMALMGTGSASGENRAIEAAKMAISSPLLENVSIAGATGILLNITGSSAMTLFEINEASRLIQEEAHEEANVIFGAVIDESMGDTMQVTVIATGFSRQDSFVAPVMRHPDDKNTPTFRPKSWGAPPKSVMPEPRRVMPSFSSSAPSPTRGSSSGFSSAEAPSLFDQNIRSDNFNHDFMPSSSPSSDVDSLNDFASNDLDESFTKPEASKKSSWGNSASKLGRGRLFSLRKSREDEPQLQQVEVTEEPGLASWRPEPKSMPSPLRETGGSVVKLRDLKSNDLKQIVSEVGTEVEDEYDIPAFIRRRAD